MKAIGIYLGTTGISGIVYDVETNRLIKAVTKNSNAFISTKNAWEKIQDVSKIVGLAYEILEELLCDDVAVIGVTGQMHSIVYYDNTGKAVSPLYIWQDGRGNLPYKNSTYAEYLNSFSGYGSVTDFYNKENGLIPENAVGFCTISDYLVMQLCAMNKPAVHTTNVASLGCFDLRTNSYNYNHNFDITDEFQIVGKYKNIPVSVAIGDNQASVLASCREEDALFNVGTGSQISIVTDNIYIADNVETRPYFENKFLVVGSALCGGRAYSLMKDFVRDIISQKVGVTDEEVYGIMSALLNNIEEPTVKADTRFAGTRADKTISGSFSCINTENFKPGEFIYSVLYGITEELYNIYKTFACERQGFVGSGNGIKKNKHLIKVVEKTFNSKLKIPTYSEEASFGAMMFGLIAIGKYKSVSEVQKLIKFM